jgi:hypothetical protein
MKRCISALAASLLLVLAGGVANAYADSSLGAPALGQENAVQSVPSTSATQPPVGQSQAPAQANTAQNEQASAVVEAANLQTGLNNNTAQASEEKTQEVLTISRVPSVDENGGNEHNGNTNTVGDQTAVNGNNFQQSNEQTQSSNQPRSGGACCPKTDGRSNDTHGAGQQNNARNEQASFVAKAADVQTGLNNNTVQLGSGNESNHNTNTAGDQTAVNGNNFQQSNEQTSSPKGDWKRDDWKRDDWKRDDCHSGCSPKRQPCDSKCSHPGADNESNGNTNTVGDQTAVNGNNFQQSNEQSSGKGDWKGGGSQQNRARNEQHSFVLGAANLQTGLNNNTVQVGGGRVIAPARRMIPGGGGGGNESNGNTNTAGDQTAVNGNNFQQSNESNGSGASQSNSSDGGWKDRCGCREDGNRQGAIVLGGLNVQTGLNNNTVQIGSGNESNHNTNTVGDQTAVNGNNFQQSNESNGGSGGDWKRSGGNSPGGGQQNNASSHQGAIVLGAANIQTGLNNNTVQIGSGNESNGNTNTVGDQTAVNGNNFQQSNEQTSSGKGDWKGGDWKGDDCHSRCEPRPERCEPTPKCSDTKRPEHGTQPAGKSNHASNHQGAIVIGGLNVQTGLNNNTVQIGSGNESNHNTNTVGDQTAVNGNNFQQSNESSKSTRGENGNWKGGDDWKRDDCNSRCEPKRQSCEPRPKCEPKPQRCEPEPKCEPKPKCPDEKRPEHSSHPAGQQNSASNRQASFVLGALNVQTGLNNNTVQIGGRPMMTPFSPINGGSGGNESNGNTNTVGDQTAVNGNNFQQTNTRALG